VLIPLRVVLAASSRLARATHSRTKPPTTVAPAITFPPAKVTLAAQPRPPRYRTRSFFTQAPQFAAVVPPPTLEQLKPRVFLTRRGPVRLTQSKLRPPAFVAYPATQEQRTVRLHLAPHPKQGRRTMWKLRPPTVIGAFQNLAPPYLEGDSGGADFEGPGGSLTPTGGPGSSDFEGVAGVTG
jgi:hypothetical protein